MSCLEKKSLRAQSPFQEPSPYKCSNNSSIVVFCNNYCCLLQTCSSIIINENGVDAGTVGGRVKEVGGGGIDF